MKNVFDALDRQRVGTRTWKSRLKKLLFGKSAVIAGQMSQSIFHFGLNLLLIRFLSTADFGVFAFIQVLVFLGTSVSNAFSGTPLSVYASGAETPKMKHVYEQLMSAMNIIVAGVLASIVGGVALVLGASLGGVLIACLYGFILIERHYSRVFLITEKKYAKVGLSDLTYMLVSSLCLGGAFVYGGRDVSLEDVWLCLLIGYMCALIALFSQGYARNIVVLPHKKKLEAYSDIWKESSRWTFLGVVTTEFTKNAHSYIITLIAGAQAFAPVAAATILFRPLNVISSSLILMERPLLAKEIAQGNNPAVQKIKRVFLSLLFMIWVGTGLCLYLFWEMILTTVFADKYDEKILFVVVVIWMVIMGIRCFSSLLSLLFQARKDFRPLSLASVISAGPTLVCTTAFLLMFSPAYSLIGLVLGELLFLFFLQFKQRKTI